MKPYYLLELPYASGLVAERYFEHCEVACMEAVLQNNPKARLWEVRQEIVNGKPHLQYQAIMYQLFV